MRLQKLRIHNIASITDTEVAFDEAPLVNSHLFLICGNTGTGKTTILNAITLALYNTAPNLEAISSKEKDEEDVSINNPAQLMRRGTLEASVSLSFIGNDEHKYIASWSVRRTKRSWRLQTIQHKLYCVDTDETLSSRKAVKEKIEQIVGLSYVQFCRTTLLAQGEFSKFLNSDEKEKTGILEKLTGTELYAQIGTQIFQTMRDKERTVSLINWQLEDIEIMSEEEERQFIAGLQEKQEEYKVLTAKRDAEQKKFTWFDEESKLNEELNRALIQKKENEDELGNETNRSRQQIIRLWDETSDIRHLLDNKDEALKTKNEYALQLGGKKKLLGLYLRGVNYLSAQKQLKETQASKLREAIESQKGNVKTYEAAGEIRSFLQTAIEKAKAEHEQEAEIKVLMQRQIKEESINAAQNKYQEAQHSLEEWKSKEQALSIKCSAIDYDAIVKAISDNKEKELAIKNAVISVDEYVEAETKVNEALENLQSSKDILRKTEENKAVAEEKVPELEATYKEYQNKFDGKKELVDHLVSIRKKFEETHECPLCGSHVDGLHTDEFLNNELQEAERLANDAKDRREANLTNLNKLKAQIGEILKSVSRQQDEVQVLKQKLQGKAAKAETLCGAQGCDYKDTHVKTKLDSLLAALAEKNNVDNQHLNDANELSKEIEGVRKQMETVRNNAQTLKDEYDSLVKKRDSLLEAVAGNKKLLASIHDDYTKALDKAKALITFEINWEQTSFEAIIGLVTEEANNYANLLNDSSKLTNDIENLDSELSRSQNVVKSLQDILGVDHEVGIEKVDHVYTKLMGLDSEVNKISGSLNLCCQNIQGLSARISSYFDAHQDVSAEVVDELRKITLNTIADYKTAIIRIKDEGKRIDGVIDNVRSRQSTHASQKPPMGDDDNMMTTQDAFQSLKDQCEKLKEEIIEKQGYLKTNNSNKEKYAKQFAQLQAAQAEYNNWFTLEKSFGGADGNKFRKIAQSYVLSILLKNANFYLKELTQRYVLECDEGSLVINVIDNNQGGAKRSANSLSGGETFVVSLALALGLASISTRVINVDTLFIDEGFGTLDEKTLDTVMSVLERLHELNGRRVGIVSHVVKLQDRIPTQIILTKNGPSSSKVEVMGTA